jgi:hypothetical protein
VEEPAQGGERDARGCSQDELALAPLEKYSALPWP